MGIEPTSSAWEAEVLPLNHTRNTFSSTIPIIGEGITPYIPVLRPSEQPHLSVSGEAVPTCFQQIGQTHVIGMGS